MDKTIQRIVEVPLNEVQSRNYEKNLHAAGDDGSNCIICGKKQPKGAKLQVQYLTNGNIVSTDQEIEGSQGFFPVGNDCARKLVIKFAF